jgi:hypothetical protein
MGISHARRLKFARARVQALALQTHARTHTARKLHYTRIQWLTLHRARHIGAAYIGSAVVLRTKPSWSSRPIRLLNISARIWLQLTQFNSRLFDPIARLSKVASIPEFLLVEALHGPVQPHLPYISFTHASDNHCVR